LRALRTVGRPLVLGTAATQRHGVAADTVIDARRRAGRDLVERLAGRAGQAGQRRPTVVGQRTEQRVGDGDVVLRRREATAGVTGVRQVVPAIGGHTRTFGTGVVGHDGARDGRDARIDQVEPAGTGAIGDGVVGDRAVRDRHPVVLLDG